jgi:hypothetical protein
VKLKCMGMELNYTNRIMIGENLQVKLKMNKTTEQAIFSVIHGSVMELEI